jgi:hypothetical protein
VPIGALRPRFGRVEGPDQNDRVELLFFVGGAAVEPRAVVLKRRVFASFPMELQREVDGMAAALLDRTAAARRRSTPKTSPGGPL